MLLGRRCVFLTRLFSPVSLNRAIWWCKPELHPPHLAANSSSSSALPGGESCQRARQTMGVRLNKRRAAGLICVVLTVWLQSPHHTPSEPFLSDEPEPETSQFPQTEGFTGKIYILQFVYNVSTFRQTHSERSSRGFQPVLIFEHRIIQSGSIGLAAFNSLTE